MKTNIAIFLGLCIGMISCKKDDFLTRYPQTAVSEPTFFKNENDLKLYLNKFYDLLPVQGLVGDNGIRDIDSDNFLSRPDIVEGKITANNNGGGWDFGNIRNVNFFLNRYQRTAIDPKIQNYYVAEAKFFKAYLYWRLVVRYGDVPWLSKDLDVSSPELYNPRTPRNIVMDSVLNDLNFAATNLKSAADAEVGRLNSDIALALKSRVCLWEGTYRKNFGLDGATKYLNECVAASVQLIDSKRYALYSTGDVRNDYYNLFIQDELKGNKEAIMARRYLKDIVMNNTSRASGGDISKDFVQSILCSDGKPIALSNLYQGEETLETEANNRDNRFKQLIETKGHVNFNNTDGTQEVSKKPNLPETNGYFFVKFRSPNRDMWQYGQSTLDLFIFRYAEILLNYAEAKAELGGADQSVIDNSINLLRDRVGMSRMNIATLVKDPKSDFPNLPVLLDEIRRERRVELMGDGLRYDDIIRWKAGKLFENPYTLLGLKLTATMKAMYPADDIKNIMVDGNGYIRKYTDISSRKWEDKQYVYPIPPEQLALNKNLKQNSGY